MSNPINPQPPAGWYPDSRDETAQRYWDGSAWTEHTAPATVQPPVQAPPVTHPQYGSPPTYDAPVQMAGSTKSRMSPSKIALISGGGVLALIVIISVAAGAGNRAATQPQVALVATATPRATPAPTPTVTPTVEPVEAEAPAVVPAPVVDPEYFRNSANRDMDDMVKDLDDMVVALDEAGTLRILGNSVEIEFNLGQLQGLEAPASTSGEWAAGLVSLETSITAMVDAAGNSDYTDVRGQVDAIRAQIGVLRDVVSRTT